MLASDDATAAAYLSAPPIELSARRSARCGELAWRGGHRALAGGSLQSGRRPLKAQAALWAGQLSQSGAVDLFVCTGVTTIAAACVWDKAHFTAAASWAQS